jgi:predicted Zn finger-like uncharacterized protein
MSAMLFTRCPECETTFRVTDDTLKKASGQVRCGRCASVFNAYAELHDPTAKSFEPDSPATHAVDEEPAAPPRPTAVAPTVAPPPPKPERPAVEPGASAVGSGAPSVAPVVAETKLAVAEADVATADGVESQPHARPISANEVERVLATDVAAPLPASAYVWAVEGLSERGTSNRWWATAAAVALLALGAQATNHFRSELASHSTFGRWIARAYAAFGAKITPDWDVQQYEIIDWVATAEPNPRGLGSLKITARIQNRGSSSQPYPAVQLRLKDRWEEAVGSRMFTPAEYLPGDAPRGRLMSPGETARAEIEVVDPGPDTYGFELDVCIEVEASLVTCGTDEVFL